MTRRDTSETAKRQAVLDRRGFVAGMAAAGLSTVGVQSARSAKAGANKYRVAVIGHTGKGNYGHGLDQVWLEIPDARIVAVADADPKGLDAAVTRPGNPAGFADYRKMLDEVKPDLVAVAPRWLDQHCEMVVAAAERGARGIYLEKPMCPTLAEADRMVAACEKHNVKLAIAHQTRYSPKLPVVRELIASGRIGQVMEFRGRGKEDRRGGGEDLWVLGTHVLNLTDHLGGTPQWCFGRVTQEGKPVTPDDVAPGPEGIGPLAGDEVHAMYGLEGGRTAYFDSVRNMGTGHPRFGLWIYGSEGVIRLTTGHLPGMYFLPDPFWSPGRSGKAWLPITSAGVDQPEPLSDGGLHAGNVLAVQDLIAAVEEDRDPQSNIYEARTAIEMIVAVFESHRLGAPVTLPLENRENPLTLPFTKAGGKS